MPHLKFSVDFLTESIEHGKVEWSEVIVEAVKDIRIN